MAVRSPKPKGIDVDDDVAATLLSDHVRAAELDPAKLWEYELKEGKGADWRKLYQHRHILMDAIAATKGRTIKMKRWERQVAKFLDGKAAFDKDQISLVCKCPMHIRQCKEKRDVNVKIRNR